MIRKLYFLLSLSSFTAQSSNHHEHWDLLFSLEDYEKAHRKTFNTEFSAFDLKIKFPIYSLVGIFDEKTVAKLLEIQDPNFSRHPERYENVLQNFLQRQTLSSLADSIANVSQFTKKQVLKRLFGELPHIERTRRMYLSHMIFLHQIHARLRKSSDSKDFVKFHSHLARSFCKRVPLSDRYIINATIAMSGMGGKDIETDFLKSIKDAFKESGTTLEILIGFTRKTLTTEHKYFETDLRRVKKYLQLGLAKGVDITGAISDHFRKNITNNTEASIFKANLTKLARTVGSVPNSQFRFHGHEGKMEFEPNGTPKGDARIYEIFFEVFEALGKKNQLPKEIIAGHCSGLSEQHLHRYITLRGQFKESTEFIFNINPISNGIVSKHNYFGLVNKIHKLHSHGFKILIGADGYAILGDGTSFAGTIVGLRGHGLNERSMEKLIFDSANHYFDNTPDLEKTPKKREEFQLKFWEEIETRMKESDYHFKCSYQQAA